MGKTKIEWTERTLNPSMGCNIVTKECDNCYAMKMAHRLALMGNKDYQGTTRQLTSGKIVWTGKVTHDMGKMEVALKIKKPTMFFVDSMSDLFHQKNSYEFIRDCYQIIIDCPQHTFQILTKRETRALEIIPEVLTELFGNDLARNLPNAWTGVSVGIKESKPRINVLRKIPSHVRMLSIEPLLEDLGDLDLTGIHWVIVGSESGTKARPMDYSWVENIFNQCREQHVAFYMKQIVLMGKKIPFEEFPEKIRVREYPNV